MSAFGHDRRQCSFPSFSLAPSRRRRSRPGRRRAGDPRRARRPAGTGSATVSSRWRATRHARRRRSASTWARHRDRRARGRPRLRPGAAAGRRDRHAALAPPVRARRALGPGGRSGGSPGGRARSARAAGARGRHRAARRQPGRADAGAQRDRARAAPFDVAWAPRTARAAAAQLLAAVDRLEGSSRALRTLCAALDGDVFASFELESGIRRATPTPSSTVSTATTWRTDAASRSAKPAPRPLARR